MFRHHRSAIALLEHRLGCSETLSTAQREALATLPIRIVELAARHDIVHEMDPSVQSCLIIEGMAHSSKMDFEGKRQIIALHLPGDLPDLHSFYLSNIDSTISTMTACRIGIIRHEHFEELAADPFFCQNFCPIGCPGRLGRTRVDTEPRAARLCRSDGSPSERNQSPPRPSRFECRRSRRMADVSD